MDEVYRLTFRGEVLQGQHASVVKKRLAGLLNLDEAQAEKLFAGRPVVLKREVDRRTAAKFQALFKKAGARLRVRAVESAGTTKAPEPESSSSEASPTQVNDTTGEPTEGTSTLDVLPAGSDVLTTAERQTDQACEVNTDHLSVLDVGSDLGAASDSNVADAPVLEISHLSLAEVGIDLHQADERNHSTEIPAPVVDFEIAEVGSDVLPQGPDQQPELEVEIDIEGFDLAEVGADIGQADDETAPPAPDISHLSLDD